MSNNLTTALMPFTIDVSKCTLADADPEPDPSLVYFAISHFLVIAVLFVGTPIIFG